MFSYVYLEGPTNSAESINHQKAQNPSTATSPTAQHQKNQNQLNAHPSFSMKEMYLCNSKLPHELHQTRTFIAARIKWVCDPYLDTAVSKEKDLKQAISFKNQILSSPSKSLPLSSLSLLKPQLNLSISAHRFFQRYPSFFSQFQPSPSRPFHIKLTTQALALHREEEQLLKKSQPLRDDAIKRLAKFLMLTRVKRLPLHVVDLFRYDLGLPHDYITVLLSDYPEYFHICEDNDCLTGKDVFFLELVCWKYELAVSEIEKRASNGDVKNVKRGERIGFPLSFPSGFDLKKKVRDWVFEWQGLQYVSPYENAFHLNPNGDQAEKWTVAILHELLWLLVSKKTEKENVLRFGDYLGLGDRFKKALVHHPGIFYVSNKIRTQTVVLREAYRKDFLVQKHPLMGMRFRYIHLMNKEKEKRRRKSVGGVFHTQAKRQVSLSPNRREGIKVEDKSREGAEENLNSSLDSEFVDMGSSDSRLEDSDDDGIM